MTLLNMGGIIINRLSKKLIFIFLILIFIIYGCLLFKKLYSEWTQNKIFNRQIENKTKTIETFKDNKDIFDTLVRKIYSRDEEIEIDFSNDKIQMLIDGKEEKLNEEYQILFEKLYYILKCKRIRLYKNSSKIIEIYLPSVGPYVQLINFSKDKYEEEGDEFSPGWYYKTLWFT